MAQPPADVTGLRSSAAFLHIAKCAGSSVVDALHSAVGPVQPPSQQFDGCYLAGFQERAQLDPAVAATVAWDNNPLVPGPYVFHQHWSLPTLQATFEPLDIATVLREPMLRTLSHITFTRAMSQDQHRRWNPDRLPADIARVSLVDVLQLPRAARATDNLIVRQVMWGDTRIPAADFIDPSDIPALAADALARLQALGFVGVVERMADAWLGLGAWLGAPLAGNHRNKTRPAQVPGLLAKPSDVDVAVQLLHDRSTADTIVWQSFADAAGIGQPHQHAQRMIEQRMRALCSTAFYARFFDRPPPSASPAPATPTSRRPDDLESHHTLLVDFDVDEIPQVDGLVTFLGVLADSSIEPMLDRFSSIIAVDDTTTNERDALAGRDFQSVIVGPRAAWRAQPAELFANINEHLKGPYNLTMISHPNDFSRLLLAANQCGWRIAHCDHGDLVTATMTRQQRTAADSDANAASGQVTHYGVPIDLDSTGDSRAVVLRLADGAATVLELGCSEGLMTRVMASRGQSVTGVEFDPDAAASAARFTESMVVANLEHSDALDPLVHRQFDLILVCDVLEHLRNPGRVLAKAVTLLADGGSIIVSIPNVAHADIRLALLDGQFEYQELGLLDQTHIHLFTYASLLRLLRSAGLEVTKWDRTIRPVDQTEIATDPKLVDIARPWFDNDPDALTYQWILTCRPADRSQAVADPLPRLDSSLAERIVQPNALYPHIGLRTSLTAVRIASNRWMKRRIGR